MTNLSTLARKWQEKWEQARLYEANPDKREKFFITVPYPYISGSLHIGHARVVTEADVYARYQRMSGKNTLYPLAFHVSGITVLGISLAIENGNEKTIELYKEYVRAYVNDEQEVNRIVTSFVDPKNIVDFFIPKMKDEFSHLGLGVDWRRSFVSDEPMHQKMVEWLFHKYKEKGYLVQGKYPVLYSTTLKNAVGEDDIKDGDTNPVEKQEFTLIKYGFENGYIVAATLRPETMYGQTNLWVNPEITYVKARVDAETWIISEECAEKLSHQDHDVQVLSRVKGMDLLGKTCYAPFVERDLLILPSTLCNPAIGTGIVTSVPSDAPADHLALKELQTNEKLLKTYKLDAGQVRLIQPIPVITSKGYGPLPAADICKKLKLTSISQTELLKEATQEIYKVGFHTGIMNDNCAAHAGMSAAKAKDAMRTNLITSKRGATLYETNRPAQSRDGGNVIVAILDNQWFLDFTAPGWKDLAQQCLDNMHVVPEKYRKQFQDVFAWLEQRPCARRRGLGTQLPFDKEWVIESLSDSVIYMTLYPIAHLIRTMDITADHMNTAFFDYIYNGEGTDTKTSQKTGIPVEQLHTLREHFTYWYPNDHRHTFPPHLPNHLSFMIFAHVATLNKEHWPKKISFHGMVLSEGTKMSKSKGNVVTLLHVDKTYGPDVFRAFLCTATSVESTLNWETDKVEHMHKHLASLYDTLLTATQHQNTGSAPPHLKWFLSAFERAKQRATRAIAHMDLRTYAMTVLYDINTIYKNASRECSEEEFHRLNGHILTDWITLLCPLIPHVAEELWQKSGHTGFLSTTPWPNVRTQDINPIEEFKHTIREQLRSDIKTVMALAKIEHPHRITIIISPIWKYTLYSMIKDLLDSTSDPKALINSIMATDLKQYGPDVMKTVPALLKDRGKLPELLLDQHTEQHTIESVRALLETEFSTSIIVETAEDSSQPKSKNAAPAKPAIVVE